jgi:hypothetical protein
MMQKGEVSRRPYADVQAFPSASTSEVAGGPAERAVLARLRPYGNAELLVPAAHAPFGPPPRKGIERCPHCGTPA